VLKYSFTTRFTTSSSGTSSKLSSFATPKASVARPGLFVFEIFFGLVTLTENNMSKQEEANLILKLYDLRREEKMRKARDWVFLNFNPESMDELNNAMFSEHSGYIRMVLTYWDMAAALVNHGAISLELFNDTNGEHISVFSKFAPFISELRAAYGPQYAANLEKLIDASPNGRERVSMMRERIKAIKARVAAGEQQTSQK
jgi:hypothetical protein